MTSLLTTVECRALVKTALSESELQAVIDRVEAMITAKIGPAQDDENTVTIAETVDGNGEHLFTKVAFSEVVSITEDGQPVDADEYQVYGDSGMVAKKACEWGEICVITYKPIDQQSERIQAAIDLVRLMIERTAMVSESVAGEYSYNAPNWEVEKTKILRRLMLGSV